MLRSIPHPNVPVGGCAARRTTAHGQLPDIFLLSHPTPPFPKQPQQLLGYIKKDRQADALLEKLAGRLAASDSVPHWHNIAFCLTQLPLSDRGLRKLSDGFAGYKHALVSDGEVQAAFAAVLAKAKKSAGKADLKVCAGSRWVWAGGCGMGPASHKKKG